MHGQQNIKMEGCVSVILVLHIGTGSVFYELVFSEVVLLYKETVYHIIILFGVEALFHLGEYLN